MGVLEPMDNVTTWKDNVHLRQFVKFCIVGAFSTVLDWGIWWVLYHGFHDALTLPLNEWFRTTLPRIASHPDFDGAFSVFKAISFALATLNGFFWNRRWTFRIRGTEQRVRQLARFYLVNIIGLGINTLVASQIHKPGAGTINELLALATATLVTAFWNFAGHKLFTFRGHHKIQDSS